MRYLIQLHLTEHCNLRCKHCYQRGSKSPLMTIEEVRGLMLQASELATRNGFDVLKVNLTGGEPLLISNIVEYIDVILERADKLLLMTNGTLMDEKMADCLASRNVSVQVSIDGTKETHDKIRGVGSYELAMRGIRLLTTKGVRVIVGCTLHKDNFKEVTDIVKAVKESGAKKVWFDRYIPCGNAMPLDTQEVLVAMTLLAGAKRFETDGFEVGTSRALQFLFVNGIPYHCTALTKSLTIMPDGTVYPCRRMPIKLGNWKEQGLQELFNHPIRKELEKVPTKCNGCHLKESCKGGLRCLGYAVSGTLDGADPNCFLIGE